VGLAVGKAAPHRRPDAWGDASIYDVEVEREVDPVEVRWDLTARRTTLATL